MKSRPRFGRGLARTTLVAALVVALGTGGAAVLASSAGASPGGTPGSFGTVFYVDMNGSGSDCSLTAPCGSIGQALSDAYEYIDYAESAVSIEVGPGVFGEDGDYISESDVPENVTITGVPGETTIAATDINETGFGDDCGILTLEDLQIVGYEDGVINECGTLIVDNSNFEDDTYGIYSYDGDGSTSVSVTNSTFYYNEVGVQSYGDQLNVNSDTFFYDEGTAVDAENGNLDVSNSTFTQNGFGITVNTSATGTISDSTIDENFIGLGNGTTTSMFGTINVDNSEDNCIGTPPTDDGFNIDNYGDCGFSSTTGSITGVDPDLGALQNNGGDTWTQAILPTSVAYQQIPTSECPSVDQRGESRPQPSASDFCDIGAYEWAPPASIAITSQAITGPTSAGANLGDVDVSVSDAAGFPAVSPHAIDLDLTTSSSDVSFAETPLGGTTSQVEIPSGDTGGAFFFGSTIPQQVPITVTGWNLNTKLGSTSQTETVVTGPPAIVSITSGDDQSVDVGTTFDPLSVNVTDGTDNPVMDSPITFTVTSGDATFDGGNTSATVDTDDNGDATAPTLTAGTTPGGVTVEVTTTTNGVTATFNLVQLVGPPATLTIDAGNDQSAQVTDDFGTDLATTLTDQYGNPIEGATVVYTVTSGSSRFSSSTTDDQTTDVNGDTTADTLTAGTLAGAQTITASVADSPATVTFSDISVTPGPAFAITITSGNNQTALSTLAFGTPLSTTVTDQYDNPIQGDTVVYNVTNGSATFSSGPTEEQVTDAAGITSADLIAGLHIGTETVTATVQSTSVTTTFSGLRITAPKLTSTVSPFALNSDALTSTMRGEISFLALEIDLVGYTNVSLTGYSDATGTTGENSKLSLDRARVVKTYLLSQLHNLHVGGVTISTVGKGATNFIKGNGKLAANRRVVAVLS